MRRLALLQIGDIHYPDVSKPGAGLDRKDSAFPDGLADILASSPLQAVTRRLISLLETKEHIAGLLLVGDLTSRGDPAGYAECVEYLNNVFVSSRIWSEQSVAVVPGNHDIDRASVSGGADIFEKFGVLARTWDAIGMPVLASDTARVMKAAAGRGSCSVTSLNSCVGCGETRYLPTKVQNEIASLLATYTATHGPTAAFDLIGEQLDTPAFVEAHLNTATGDIESADDSCVSVILAHHNLLPQGLPRVDLYTEVVNGGLARHRLVHSDRFVIYCHGHTHERTLEVVKQPKRKRGELIMIGAPMIDEGFNYLEFQFSDRGHVLGLELIEYVYEHSNVTGGEAQRVSLIPPHMRRRSRDTFDEKILGVLGLETQRFEELLGNVRAAQGRATQARTLSDRLLELEWLGFVSISNRSRDAEYWHVRRET